MTSTSYVEPIRIYPNSTKSYSPDDMIELIKQFNGKDIIRNIDDPEEKRFAKILLELETQTKTSQNKTCKRAAI